MATCRYTASMAKNQHFRHCRKNYALDRKMIETFRIVTTFSISMQSLGEIELRAPTVGAKIGVFLYVALGLQVSLLVDFNTVFNAFFQKELFFQIHYILLIFLARCRHNFREIEAKNCEKSKNRRKSLCAPFRIDSWEI